MESTAHGVQQGPFFEILNTSCGGLGPQVFITGGAPTTISPVSAMFLRLRRKNIADTGEIVVRAPPVMKTCGPSPPQEVFRIQKKGLVAPLALSFPLICVRVPAPHVALRRRSEPRGLAYAAGWWLSN